MAARNSFRDYFSSLAMNEDGNRLISGFEEATNSRVPSADRLKIITESPDYVIFAADANKKVQIIHSLKNLGGNRFRPKNKLIGMIGLGNVAFPVELNGDSVLNVCELRTPTVDQIKNCATAEAFNALRAGLEITLNGTAIVMPAPHLRDAAMKADTSDPGELGRLLLEEAKEFDRTHAEDNDFEESMAHAENLCLWLWGIANEVVPPVTYTLRPEDGEMQEFARERQEKCILPPIDIDHPSAGASNSAFVQLTESISRQTEEAKAANDLRRREIDRQIEREEAKKDRMKKLHGSFMNMILMASAEDDDRPADEPVASCKAFFNCENEGKATQELIEQFADCGVEGVSFGPGLINGISSGQLLYFSPECPSNLSIFTIFKQEGITSHIPERCVLLHLMSSEGRGKSEDEIKKMTKQIVKVPIGFDGATKQLKCFITLLEILLGPDSVGTLGGKRLGKKLELYETEFNVRVASDPLFVAKFMYAIDTRYQRWFKQCKRARDRSEVDNRIVDFDDLLNDILNNRFTCFLPPMFMSKDNNDRADGGRTMGQ